MSRILPADGVEFEFTVPVVVIGGGAAGMVAALATHEQGAGVLVWNATRCPRAPPPCRPG